jgi:hypothetical protein
VLATPRTRHFFRQSPLAAPIVSPREGVGPQDLWRQRAWAPLCHQLMRLRRHPDSGSRERSASAQTRLPARPSATACPARLRRTACTVPVLERRWQTASDRKMRSESRRHFPETSGRPNCPDVRVLSQRTRPLLPPESLSPFDGVCKSTSPRMVSTPAAFRCTRCHDSAGSCHSKTGVAMAAFTLSGLRSRKLSRVQGQDRSRGRRGISSKLILEESDFCG